MHGIDRRSFLKQSATGLGLIIAAQAIPQSHRNRSRERMTMMGYAAPPLDVVRIGYVGVGGMGTAHVENLLKIPGAEIRAVCDIVPARVERAQQLCLTAGYARPDGYARGEHDYRNLCSRDDLDLVYIATPWEWHVPMCLEALSSGKHAAVEVPAALTLDECWQLVEASESARRHCMMMENCNYDKLEMMILGMVKKGLFGELLHAECGYLHDLRAVKHDLGGEGVWRRAHSMKRNGDLYPTHGLGPVAQCLDINRGNYFESLLSLGSKTKGLHLYALEQFGVESPQAREEFVLSDVVTTLLRTKRGETIILKHDTSSPRPYSRDILIQGTRGIVRKYPDPKIHIEGKSEPHRWEPVDNWITQHNHPVWAELEEKSRGAGHGGMDFIEDYRLIDALRSGTVPDMDVYDAVVLSAVTELSGTSIAHNGEPIPFPDFTDGHWREERELPVMRLR